MKGTRYTCIGSTQFITLVKITIWLPKPCLIYREDGPQSYPTHGVTPRGLNDICMSLLHYIPYGLKFSRVADFHYIFADAGSFIVYYIERLYICTNRMIKLSRMVLTVNVIFKEMSAQARQVRA